MAPMNVEKKELRDNDWKWVGEITGQDQCKTFYGLVKIAVDSDYTIEVNLSDGESSFLGSVENEAEPRESLAYMPASSRLVAIRKSFLQKPPLARVENGELRISVPWGIEYNAAINLDVESIRLEKVQGSTSFLTLLFGQIEKRRQVLQSLQERAHHMKTAKSDLRRAQNIIEGYLNSRPERLRIAAQILNEFKTTCRLTKGEEHGPEENIGKD